MKLMKYLLPVAVATLGLGATLLAHDGEGTEEYGSVKEARQRDSEALRDYVRSKRAITVKEKGGNLVISGDIRMEYYYMHARTDGKSQRGMKSRKLYPNSSIKKAARETKGLPRRKILTDLRAPYKTSEFDIETNLIFDYMADRGWGTVQLQLSNLAGIVEMDRKPYINDSRNIMYGSGKIDKIALRKAYFGYNIWEEGTSRFDLEIGRRRLYDIFESDIQYYSYFDGILARFSNSFEGITDLSAKVAAFVVDQTVNHYGYIGELGFLNIGDSGLDVKYSLVHWDKKGENRYGKRHPYGVRFINSQLFAGYSFSPDVVSMKTYLYGAYVINHDAKRNKFTRNRKANDAFYVGVKMGEVLRKGDYAFGFGYQWIQAQSISDRDISGIYRDNPRGISFYNRRSGGYGNCKGWRIEGLYAVSDNWTLNAHFDRVRELNRHIGGKHRSYEFYLAAIFAF